MTVIKSKASSNSFSMLFSTERSIEQIKLLAKHLRKAFPQKDMSQVKMLETCARALGFNNWHELNEVHQAALTSPIKDARMGAMEFMTKDIGTSITREKDASGPSLTQILPLFSFDCNLEKLIQTGRRNEISEVLFKTLKISLEWAEYEKEELICEFYDPSVDSRETLEKAVSVLSGTGFIHCVDYLYTINHSNDEELIKSKLINWVENSDHPNTAGDTMSLANIHFQKAQSIMESGLNPVIMTAEFEKVLELLDKAEASNEKHGKNLIHQIHSWRAQTLLELGRPVESLKAFIISNETEDNMIIQDYLEICPKYDSPLNLKKGTVSQWDVIFEMLALCKTPKDQRELLTLAPLLIKASVYYLNDDLDLLSLPVISQYKSTIYNNWSSKKTILEMQNLVNIATNCGMDLIFISSDESIAFDMEEDYDEYIYMRS